MPKVVLSTAGIPEELAVLFGTQFQPDELTTGPGRIAPTLPEGKPIPPTAASCCLENPAPGDSEVVH